MSTDNLYKPAPTQRQKSDRTNPRNRVSSLISRTQPKFVAETRFLATQRLKLERPNPVAGWGRVYVDYL